MNTIPAFTRSLVALAMATAMVATAQAQEPAPASGASNPEHRDRLDLAWQEASLDGARRSLDQATPACPNGLCPGLGNAFYLPALNAQSINTGGRVIFVNRKLGECADVHGDIDYTEKRFKNADSMKTLTNQMMSESTLEGSATTAALSMKGSIMALSNQESTTTTTFQSTHMDIQDISHAINFRDDESCVSEGNIEPAVLRRFTSLPLIDEKNAAHSASWLPYVNLLKETGSHIMLQQLIGSRFQQWESNTSTAKDALQTLQIKACAKVEGVQPSSGWSVDSCAGFTKAQKEKALATESSSQRIILGSSKAARQALTDDVNKTTLDLFLRDSEQGNEAIRFGYKPIFLVFHAIYQHQCHVDGPGSEACRNVQRAVTLEAAYDGWIAIGCTEQRANNDQFVVQSMQAVGSNAQGIHSYQCKLAALGCKTDRDCHVGSGTAVTYCYGPTCIDKGALIPPTDMFRNAVRTKKSGSYNEGVNKSCYYKADISAHCHKDWASPRIIYAQGR